MWSVELQHQLLNTNTLADKISEMVQKKHIAVSCIDRIQ